MTVKKIAKALGRNPSTVSKELKRNSENNTYNPNYSTAKIRKEKNVVS